jgi:hypothetical protein
VGIRRSNWRWTVQVTLDRSTPLPQEHWPAHRGIYLDVFRSHAERYRRRKRFAIALFMLSLLLGSGFFAINAFNVFTVPVIVFVIGGLLVSSLMFVFGLKLICPACRKRLEPARGLYCPRCGSDRFEHGKHRTESSGGRDRYCPSCETRILEEDGDSARSYRIHGCTHCGVMLDENGV